MTAFDTAKAVLGKASLYDQTFANPDLGIAVAWAQLFEGINHDDALTSVETHYAAQTRRIMPADVLAGVRRIRATRIERAVEDVPAADADPSDVAGYLAELRKHRGLVADGHYPRIVRHPKRDVEGLMDATLKRLPRIPRAKDETA